MVNDIAERIRNIDWFSNIGVVDESNSTYMYADNLEDAVSSSLYFGWDNIRLDARNNISDVRFKRGVGRIENWNDVVIPFRKFLDDDIIPYIDGALLGSNVYEELKGSISWDLMGVLLEDTYRKYNHGVTFYSELLEIYESGHLPCGWYGDYPEGKFVIY